MPFPFDIMRYVDKRFKQLSGDSLQVGTATRGSYLENDVLGKNRIDVLFEGSGIAAQVKCFEGVQVTAGDRVGLAKLGSDWVCFGSFQSGWPNIQMGGGPLTTGSTSSTIAFSNVPGSFSLNFTKRHDHTAMLMIYMMTCYPSAISSGLNLGILTEPLDNNGVFGLNEITNNAYWFNTIAHETVWGATLRPNPAGTPFFQGAGRYRMTPQWKVHAAGTMNTDGLDSQMLIIMEVGPTVGNVGAD